MLTILLNVKMSVKLLIKLIELMYEGTVQKGMCMKMSVFYAKLYHFRLGSKLV